jgi:hypothetical protein
MAKMVLTAAFTKLGSDDLSAYCSKVELVTDVEEKDVTTFASSGWKEFLGGLKGGKLTLEFFQDIASSAIDSILWPQIGNVVAFEVRNTSAAVGPTNPKWTGSVVIPGYSPVSGKVGDTANFTLGCTVTGAVTRATA